MQLSTLALGLLVPVLALAQDSSSSATLTLTSTATMTKTITVSEVVASVTSTYKSLNTTTSAGPTAVGTGVKTTGTSSLIAASATSTLPSNFMSGANSLSGMYAGGVGIVVMVAASLL